ncbi:MAG: NERD domain-containing protein [Clostridia bacterium]|nr:NERD domain-containing protein [Clostridia bacterium]
MEILRIWSVFCEKLGGERKALLLLSVFASVCLIVIWLCHYHSHEVTARRLGKQGEAKVKKLLKNTKSSKKKILNDVILEFEYGNTTQIDHILINEYGVFVMETKNYKGVIYGTEGKSYWKQYLKNKSFTFYNPIKQNEGHIRHLKEMFGKKYPYYSVIVFVGSTVKKIDSDVVFSLNELEYYLDSFNRKVLSPKDIRTLYRAIRATQKHKRKLNRRHLRNMKRFQRK